MRARQFRSFVQVGMTCVVAIALSVACSPAGSGRTGSGDGDKADDGKSGRSARPFVVARTSDIDLLDPARATAFQTVQTLDLVYDTLLETDPDSGKLRPGLATKWDVTDAGKTVTLTLRDGVKFHNGDALTAADAKATLERVLDKKTGSVVASYLGNVSGIDAPDDTTLVLTLRQPDTALLNALTYVGTSILDHNDIDAGTIARKVNGSGPFGWKSWEQGQKVTLTANRAYWGGAPKLDTVELRVIPDESSILSAMNAGTLDLGIITDPSIAKQVKPSKMGLESQSTLSYHVLQLNGRRGPLRKLAARQAVACAIDRQEVIDTAYFGKGEPTGPITSPAFRYSATTGLPCSHTPDRAMAKSLLAKAGYPRGFQLDTIVMVGNYATATNIAQSLQAQLAKIGVRLKLQQQQSSVYVKSWLAADFDAAVARNGGSTDPYLMYGRYFTTGSSLAGPAGLSDQHLDLLLREANATTNPTTRRQIFEQLQHELLRLSPWVWLIEDQSYYLTGNDVRGFAGTPTESLEYLAKTSVRG